jgi:hypothetical protein
MPRGGSEADLAAIATAYELNYAVAANFADDPIVVAAVAHAKPLTRLALITHAQVALVLKEAEIARRSLSPSTNTLKPRWATESIF